MSQVMYVKSQKPNGKAKASRMHDDLIALHALRQELLNDPRRMARMKSSIKTLQQKIKRLEIMRKKTKVS